MVVQLATNKNKFAEVLYEKIGFSPTELQKDILNSRKRFILVAGGEQAGKSMVASKYLVARLFENDEPGLFWLVAADYERTRAEFEYLVEDFGAMGLLQEASKRVDPGRIILADGTRIETKSAKDPRTLAMRAPNGIIGCEASQLDLETFHRLRGRCAPKRGWLFLSGTFEGSLGWYPQMFQAWQASSSADEVSFSLPSYSNAYLYPGGREDPEILALEKASSDDFFLERIEGIPSPPQGMVFTEIRPDIHVQNVEYEPDVPVHLWIDPGYAEAYAVEVIQVVNDQIRVIDEIYERDLITDEIIEIAQSKIWWKDARFGVIDVAGYQHQAMAAPAEVWMDKTGIYFDSEKIRINDGTERLKAFLKTDPVDQREPRIVFNPKCEGILSEFGIKPNPFDGQTRAYRWKMDRDGTIVGETPEDRYNHGIKAVIYGLINRYGYGYITENSTIKVKRW
tara:strand:+ start:1471 stop:2829 length:1359 start_codon:yes stop_codon:yes gene_type:complete